MLAVARHQFSVDEHVLYASGALVRSIVRRAVSARRGIEQDNIRVVTGREHPATLRSEIPRWQ